MPIPGQPYLLCQEDWARWDAFTISSKQTTVTHLVQQAAQQVMCWLHQHIVQSEVYKYFIFCGSGNNGADGLCLASLLLDYGIETKVYCANKDRQKPAFTYYYNRLTRKYPGSVVSDFNTEILCDQKTIIIDALLGSGVNRPVSGLYKDVISRINQCKNTTVISLDCPSGLFDFFNKETDTAVCADITLTFELAKIPLVKPEFGLFCGRIFTLTLGLDYDFFKINENKNKFYVANVPYVRSMWKPRITHTHKGNFGHTLIMAGSKGSMGACILASKAALRVGVGKVTALIPDEERTVIQIAVPEAQCIFREHNECLKQVKPNSLLLGPGMGLDMYTCNLFYKVLELWNGLPKVLDADAITLLSNDKKWGDFSFENTICTPHAAEFRRMVGACNTWDEENEKAQWFSQNTKSILLLKGAYTRVFSPDGENFIFDVGHPGMATGGSGDVLAGIVAGLLAQGYGAKQAAHMGVYLHGLAAQYYVKQKHEVTLIAGDIIDCIGNVSQIFSKYS